MAIRKPRGTQDFLPEQMINWHYIEQRMREIVRYTGSTKFAHLPLKILNYFCVASVKLQM